MKTLVIHTPDYQLRRPGTASFSQVLATGIGPGYAISPADIAKLTIPGSPVVLLRKDRRKARAEGTLENISRTGKWTRNGRQRHDVHASGFKPVLYKSERLNRFGYNVI